MESQNFLNPQFYLLSNTEFSCQLDSEVLPKTQMSLTQHQKGSGTFQGTHGQFELENSSALAGISDTYGIKKKGFALVMLLMLKNSRKIAPLVVDWSPLEERPTVTG